MKKLIFTAMALVAVAVGCTKSGLVAVPQAQKTPIAFETYNGRIPVTKAGEITRDNIDKIQVTGFHVSVDGSVSYTSTYMNPQVTRTYSDEAWGPWGYFPLSYWPATGDLEFVAYGANTPLAASGEGKLVPVGGSYAKFTYTVPEAVADQQDLIASNKRIYTRNGGTITLNMQHLLSRIGFTLKTTGSGSDVTIKTIELHGNFINTGVVDLVKTEEVTDEEGTTTTLTAHPSISTTGYSDYITPSYSLFGSDGYFKTTSNDDVVSGVKIYARYTSDGDGGFVEGDDDSNRFLMIIPGEITEAIDVDDTNGNNENTDTVAPYIKVVYQLSGTSDQTAIIPFKKENGDFWTLEAGKAYEFIFTVSISKIEFTGSVEPWDDDLDGDEQDDDDIIVRP